MTVECWREVTRPCWPFGQSWHQTSVAFWACCLLIPGSLCRIASQRYLFLSVPPSLMQSLCSMLITLLGCSIFKLTLNDLSSFAHTESNTVMVCSQQAYWFICSINGADCQKDTYSIWRKSWRDSCLQETQLQPNQCTTDACAPQIYMCCS